MSRVNDTDQQIKEFNEKQLRKRVDREKQLNTQRANEAFKQVMHNRSERKQATNQQQRAEAEKPKESDAKRVLEQVAKRQPKGQAEQARRAALARAMRGGQEQKQVMKGAVEADRAALGRASELNEGGEVEEKFVRETTREDEDRDLRKTEDKQVRAEKDYGEGPLAAVGDDQAQEQQRRRNHQGHGGQRKDERSAEQVADAGGPRAAHRVEIPPEALKQIVGAIYKAATADGRTHMQITLKGGMMEGVSLKIRAEDGKVSCEFSNCDKALSRLLEGSKGALARGLSKRGLTLESMSVA